jgi:[CysO sulfur-carrier protein]-S-L-cysteine hydrolase
VTDELRLGAEVADEMIAHALEGRPNEVCGILAGNDGEIVKVFRMTNELASPMRYRMNDLELMKVQDEIDGSGLEMVGGYHSHTRTEAYPSPTDVREASLGDLLYLIVSLMNEKPLIRAFQILKQNMSDESGDVEEIPVVIDGR